VGWGVLGWGEERQGEAGRGEIISLTSYIELTNTFILFLVVCNRYLNLLLVKSNGSLF
jgi:hypothetical protein